MRSIAILAAIAATASAAGTMVELDSSDCIVKGEALSKTQWALTLGACDADEVVEFNFVKQNGAIKVDGENLCVAAKDNSKKNGAPIVLTKCASKKNSQKWSMYENDVWRNANKKCIAFNDDKEILVQAPCNADALTFELDGCKVKPLPLRPAAPAVTVTVKPTPTPTPTPVYTCANFAASFKCPYGFFVPSNYYAVVTTPAYAVSKCCVKEAPAPRTCAEYSTEMGGPSNVCKSKYGNFELTGYLNTKCSATDDKDCFKKCCVPVAPPKPTNQTCAEYADKATGYKPACPAKKQLIPAEDLTTTECPLNGRDADGKNCADICCEDKPANIIKCSEWAAADAANVCSGFLPNLKPDAVCVVAGPVANCGANACCSK